MGVGFFCNRCWSMMILARNLYLCLCSIWGLELMLIAIFFSIIMGKSSRSLLLLACALGVFIVSSSVILRMCICFMLPSISISISVFTSIFISIFEIMRYSQNLSVFSVWLLYLLAHYLYRYYICQFHIFRYSRPPPSLFLFPSLCYPHTHKAHNFQADFPLDCLHTRFQILLMETEQQGQH